jgi:hypothetical protein
MDCDRPDPLKSDALKWLASELKRLRNRPPQQAASAGAPLALPLAAAISLIADWVRHRTDARNVINYAHSCTTGWRRKMDRFYFHIQTGERLIIDQVGTDLEDACAAKQEALLAARDIVADAIRSGHDVPEAFVIADGEGRELETVPFETVLPRRWKDRTAELAAAVN